MADNSSPFKNQSGTIGLPTQTMQNQIHELAKTLPPPRRQNIACDACRARKVKCNQLPGQDKHCLTKNYPCTHFVQQATSEKKRSSAVNRRPRALSTSNPTAAPVTTPTKYSTSPPADTPSPGSSPSPLAPHYLPYANNHAIAFPYQLPHLRSSPHASTIQLLSYLFSPESPTDPASFPHSRGRSPKISDWGEIGKRLEDDAFRVELALDLVEVFFQICHTRLPLLNPAQFRSRLKYSLASHSSPPSPQRTPPEKPVHPALLATVIAWGAKFSEHPLLVMDREGAGGQSRLARTLVNRAREVAEAEKVHRISCVDHVVIALLIEPLQNQSPDDPDGFHGFWLTCSIRHLLELQINHKSVMQNIQDAEARGTMIFAWWMACLADAYHSAYYRRKPQLDDDDYDIDFYTADPTPPEMSDHSVTPSPREQLEGYYRAAHALARTARHMSRQLWRPTTESDGISFEVLCNIMALLNDWRDEHLPRVGVPSDFESEWDFVSAVSACASDATYHVMWTILFNAVDDFGIREINELHRIGPNPNHPIDTHNIETVKHKLYDEALHGSLRIAGLTGVLTSNGYLKLDPAVMHFSCLTAGTLLARLGRPEVSNCIAGLKQYSYAYEEAADEAKEMERAYGAALSGESEINCMQSVVIPAQPAQPMSLDAGGGGFVQNGNGSSHSSTVDHEMASIPQDSSYSHLMYRR
ncbi:hypothetical protein BD410DRAFT_787431 [Rickenella mellea]|uniref:Zn(2)-C6 fungal-type domain-containing protein n=1 Tax=Rickenella mellea TaxID=50990 RepID=A0A4Y7Q727_9AGAM|nr:hypothetical protein BD410DRAFT_787431 [Rickenella mellea]